MFISDIDRRNYKYSLALRISKKLENLGKWKNIVVNWCPIIEEYVIDATEIVFNKDHYLNFITFIPVSHLDQINNYLFLRLFENIENRQQKDFMNKYKKQYILAIIGSENDLILHSISFDLEKLVC